MRQCPVLAAAQRALRFPPARAQEDRYSVAAQLRQVGNVPGEAVLDADFVWPPVYDPCSSVPNALTDPYPAWSPRAIPDNDEAVAD